MTQSAVMSLFKLFFFPRGEGETVMGTEWALMQSRQSESAVLKV